MIACRQPGAEKELRCVSPEMDRPETVSGLVNRGLAAIAHVRAALSKGDRGMRKIAADLGVGVGTVQRVAAELKAA